MDTEQPVPVLRREKGPSILQKRVDSSNMEETNVDVCVCVSSVFWAGVPVTLDGLKLPM